MAGVIKKTQEELAQEQSTQQPQSAQTEQPTTAVQQPEASAASGGTALRGVSANTSAKLNQYGQGYQQSSGVQAAQDYLNSVINKRPTADAQLSDLYDRIMNREKFSYDLNGDALYQQYKDQYQSLGKQAMMDTMGNATALTGGYGSSYASTAGNQAYQQYLQQLNDIVPDLYNAAYDRYAQEGADLMNQYNLGYGQYRDAVADWEGERDFANSDYWQKYNADYGDWQTMLNYWNQMAQMENSAYNTERDYAYGIAMAIIERGKMPSDDILAAAGLTQADAKQLGARTGSSGSSKKRSGGSGNSNAGSTDTQANDRVDPTERYLQIAERSKTPNDTYESLWKQYFANNLKKNALK